MLDRSAHVTVSDRQLVLRRTLDAPRRLVFEAWTTAEHVAQWFSPRPLVISRCEIDFRTGGVFRFAMRTPEGLEYPFDGEFGEIVPPEKIVFRGKIHGENECETTVMFSEENGKTAITVRQTYAFESDATRGAPEGWGLTLDQLAAFVARS